ncbi:MAG: SpoIIE family protein phosphatase [Bryobacteraceae bacterium]|jgi:sigma-B regulation protein RsbU (phosphoserine phosphatase)
MASPNTLRRSQISSRLGESRLEALLESAELLHASLRLEDLLRHLLRTVMGRLLVGRAAVAIRQDGAMRVALTRGVASLPAGSPFTEDIAHNAGLEQVFPIGDPELPIGLLGISKPMRGDLDPEEHDFIHALISLSASGIANAQAHTESVRLNHSLDQKIQELRALLDMVRGLAATLDPEAIAQLLALTLAGRWAVRKYAVAAWREQHPLTLRQRGLDLAGFIADKDAIAALPDAHIAAAEINGIPAGSAVFPIRSGTETSGLVVCGPRAGQSSYTESDLEFGSGLVAQASVAFDNAWHFRETLVKQQMEKELAMAAAIQQNLFPASLPQLAHTAISARNRQAKQVGGDYYDVIPLETVGPSEPHLLCVVDISGKGMFASILMSNIQATLRALLHGDSQLAALAARTNDLLYATTPSNRYATAFLTFYDPVTGECRWVNCGHNDGIILRANNTVEQLACSGLALGLFPKRTYEEQFCRLAAGDVFAIYSDGVTEAQSFSEDEFGLERLIACMRANAALPPAAIVDAVFKEIDAFTGEAPQFDDITIMIVKRIAGERP